MDDSEAGEGTVLAAHEDPEAVDKELERRFRPETSRRRPLYVTYSIPKGQDLPTVALLSVRRSPVPGVAPLFSR